MKPSRQYSGVACLVVQFSDTNTTPDDPITTMGQSFRPMQIEDDDFNSNSEASIQNDGELTGEGSPRIRVEMCVAPPPMVITPISTTGLSFEPMSVEKVHPDVE